MRGRRNLTTAVALCALAVGLCPMASGRIIYVDDSASGPNHGGSWADALLYLQDALILAEHVQEPVEIRVAQGIYKPDQGTGITPGDREATFRIPREAVLRGGYAGIGAVEPNERSIDLYATILSGDLLGDDPDVADAGALANAPSRADNSLHVVTLEQVDSCVLDGFTIRGGHATGDGTRRGGPSDGGGAVRIEDSSAILCNCTFIHNWGADGGAVFVPRGRVEVVSRLEIRNCRFLANASEDYGGAAAIYESELLLSDCEFSANTSAKGGGISSHLSDLSLSRCTIRENQAVDGSGLHHVNGNLSLSGCTFEDNSALPPGPSRGPVTRAGAVLISNSSGKQATATHCLFRHNRGFSGAAIQGDLTALRGCRFTGNTAYTRGALDTRGSLTCENCLFDGNKALDGPAVVRCRGALLFANCTFVENRSPDGYAFTAYGGHGSPVDKIFSHCILWGAGQSVESADSRPEYVSVTYSDIQGGYPGEANLDVDPCFADPGHWDPNGTPDDPDDDFWVAGDYHLKSQAGRWDSMSESWVIDDVTTPCIDGGDPNNSLGDELFPNGGIINVGAYGGTTEASRSYFEEPVCQTHRAGDINGDCAVDLADLLIVISQWTAELPPEVPTGPAPSVVIVEPIDGATLEIQSTPILIQAEAADPDGAIIAVAFEISHAEQEFNYTGTYPGRTGQHGWYLEWNWSSPEYRLPEGEYTIVAKATDDEGTTTISPPMTIMIIEAPYRPRR